MKIKTILCVAALLSSLLWAKKPSNHKLTVKEKDCPVQILDLSGQYNSFWGGTHTNMMIYVQNNSDKIIYTMKFRTDYYDPTFEKVPYIFDTLMAEHENLEPGKKERFEWDPTFSFVQYGYHGALHATLERILFKDGTTWDADKDHYCEATEFDMPK